MHSNILFLRAKQVCVVLLIISQVMPGMALALEGGSAGGSGYGPSDPSDWGGGNNSNSGSNSGNPNSDPGSAGVGPGAGGEPDADNDGESDANENGNAASVSAGISAAAGPNSGISASASTNGTGAVSITTPDGKTHSIDGNSQKAADNAVAAVSEMSKAADRGLSIGRDIDSAKSMACGCAVGAKSGARSSDEDPNRPGSQLGVDGVAAAEIGKTIADEAARSTLDTGRFSWGIGPGLNPGFYSGIPGVAEFNPQRNDLASIPAMPVDVARSVVSTLDRATQFTQTLADLGIVPLPDTTALEDKSLEDTSFTYVAGTDKTGAGYIGNVTGAFYDPIDVPGSKALANVDIPSDSIVTINKAEDDNVTISVFDINTGNIVNHDAKTFTGLDKTSKDPAPPGQAYGQTYGGPKGTAATGLSYSARAAAAVYSTQVPAPVQNPGPKAAETMAALAYAEAKNIGKTQATNMAMEVIGNRAITTGATVMGVVTAKDQFEPVEKEMGRCRCSAEEAVNNIISRAKAEDEDFATNVMVAQSIIDGTHVRSGLTTNGLGYVNFANADTVQDRAKGGVVSRSTSEWVGAMAEDEESQTIYNEEKPSIQHTYGIAKGSVVPSFTPTTSHFSVQALGVETAPLSSYVAGKQSQPAGKAPAIGEAVYGKREDDGRVTPISKAEYDNIVSERNIAQLERQAAMALADGNFRSLNNISRDLSNARAAAGIPEPGPFGALANISLPALSTSFLGNVVQSAVLNNLNLNLPANVLSNVQVPTAVQGLFGLFNSIQNNKQNSPAPTTGSMAVVFAPTLDFFGLTVAGLASQMRDKGIDVTVVGYADSVGKAAAIARAAEAAKNGVSIHGIGYSLGAIEAMDFANKLGELGINVDRVSAVEPSQGLTAQVPGLTNSDIKSGKGVNSNVTSFDVYKGTGGILGSWTGMRGYGDLRADNNTETEYNEIEVPNAGHMNMMNSDVVDSIVGNHSKTSSYNNKGEVENDSKIVDESIESQNMALAITTLADSPIFSYLGLENLFGFFRWLYNFGNEPELVVFKSESGKKSDYILVKIVIDPINKNVIMSRPDLLDIITDTSGRYSIDEEINAYELLSEPNPIVFNEDGSIAYSNGLYAPSTISDINVDVDYLYTVVYVDQNGDIVSIPDNQEIVDSNPITQLFNRVIQGKTPFVLTDVVSITYSLIDPDLKVARDEYYNYVITLNTGEKRNVHIPEYTSMAFMQKAFANIGFSGDVLSLTKLAKINEQHSDGTVSKMIENLIGYTRKIIGIGPSKNEETIDNTDLASLIDINENNILRSVFIYPNASVECPLVAGLSNGYVYTAILQDTTSKELHTLITEARCGDGDSLTLSSEVAKHLKQKYDIGDGTLSSIENKVSFNSNEISYIPGVYTGSVYSDYLMEISSETAENKTEDIATETSDEVVLLPNSTNQITFEVKATNTQNGNIIYDWTTSNIKVSTDTRLDFRWGAENYQQCLPFLNDGGKYAFSRISTKDMISGNTETENFLIPVSATTYRLECGGQKNGEGGVDIREIEVSY